MDTSFVSFVAALDPLVLMLATGALVILMLHASAAKLGDRDLFMQHLAAYGVPDAALGAMTWALPLAELVAALGLMTPWRALAACWFRRRVTCSASGTSARSTASCSFSTR